MHTRQVRMVRWLLVSVVICASFAQSAAAKPLPDGQRVTLGPVLAAGHAVFIAADGHLRALTPAGALRDLGPALPPDAQGCQGTPVNLAGDERGWILLDVYGGQCSFGHRLILRSPAGQTMVRDRPPGECWPLSSTVDAGRLVSVEQCPQTETALRVEDLASGAVSSVPLNGRVSEPVVVARGRYAAVYDNGEPFDRARSPMQILVRDLVTGAPVYRVDLTGFTPDPGAAGPKQAIDVDQHGNVAFAIAYEGLAPQRLGWASPGDPRPHPLRDDANAVGRDGGRIAIDDARVAYAARGTAGLVVVDLQGRALNSVAPPPRGAVHRAVDFLDGRLAWAVSQSTGEAYVYTERFPFTGPLEPGGPIQSDRLRALISLKVLQRGRTRTIDGVAGADARRVEVSLLRRTGSSCSAELRSGGRMVRTRSCRVRTWVRATGSRRWRVKLRRVLPTGHYVLRVRAIDRRGRRGSIARYPLLSNRGALAFDHNAQSAGRAMSPG